MDFNIPQDIADYLAVLDDFIEREIKPLEQENIQYFDHRREYERTDWDNDGAPKEEWEQLLREMKNRADKAGHLRWALPKELGGSGGSNLGMAIIREHLAHKGLGLHNDLQNESSIVGNFPVVHIFNAVGTQAQKDEFIEASITGKKRIAFGVTEPNHGSDATFMETEAKRDGDDWIINGTKRWNSGMSSATHDVVFARTSGSPGEPMGITAFIVPVETPGVDVAYMHWTFNMPSDHAEVHFRNVRVPNDAILHKEGRGLECMQAFFHENRIRQAASSLGAGQYCVDEAVKWANNRVTWGQPLAKNQAIQWPLAELNTEAEMLRNLVYKSAWHLDQADHMSVTHWVAMANYRANRFVCEAADRAMQVHGGMGYTRYKPFEHIYRHHRRYRITEGTEEIQIRKVASDLFKKFRS